MLAFSSLKKNYIISDPPEVSVEKEYHHVPLGDSVLLICFVFANPQPKVKQMENNC